MGTYYDPLWIATAKSVGWMRGASSKVESLEAGLEGGITVIDTAEIYGSEPLVARAIKGKKREDLFIATKVWSNHLRRDALVRALEKSLKRLELSYVDLYQVHFPNDKVPIGETMAAMEEMKDKGKLLFIGVSNFSLQQTKDANAALKKSQLASNQVEYSLANRENRGRPAPVLREQQNLVLAYYPLGHGKLTGARPGSKMDPVCKARSKTQAQVALNWLVSGRDVFAIPRASRASHVRENLGASGWELGPEDRALLDAAFPR